MTKVQTMKAIRIHAFGGPEVLEYEDVPRPKPSSGQVLIDRAQLSKITQLLASGAIKTFVGAKFPLAKAAQAQQASETGHVRGKIVLLIGSCPEDNHKSARQTR